jgi:hypothetical protein
MSGSGDYTQTPNFQLFKPTPDADDDLWGVHLNANADTLDSVLQTQATSYVPLNGATPMTGPLNLPAGTTAAPSLLFGTPDGTGFSRAGTNAIAVSAQGAMVAAFIGGGASGGVQFYSPVIMLNNRIQSVGDPFVPTDALNQRFADARYAPLASPAFTGNPTAPTPAPGDNDTSIATTAFVAAAVGSVPGGALIAPAAPAANPGALWWDSTGGQLYVRYDDGNSQQWVVSNNIPGLANAATKTDVAAAQNNVGRNYVHNPLFNIAQRGAGPFTTHVYTLDRWQLYFNLDTPSVSQQSAGVAGMPLDEAAAFVLTNVFTGNAGAAAQTLIYQQIEDVRRLSNKTVTISFYANAASGTPKLGASLSQNFGSGGSPSAPVVVNGQSVVLGPTWARYSLTFTLPSISGKTLGTNGDHNTTLYFWYSSGATGNTQAGGIGVQSGTINLWGVQLEIGPTATPLEKPDPQQDLAKCQRFYQTGSFAFYMGATGAFIYGAFQPFIVSMRAIPTIAPSYTTQTNCTGSVSNQTGYGFMAQMQATAAGQSYLVGAYNASADL